MPHRLDHLVNLLLRTPAGIASRARILRLRALGARLGRANTFRRVMLPANPWDLRTGDHVTFDQHVVLLSVGERRAEPRLRFGNGIYVNRFTMFDASELIEVADEVMIGPHCYITDHDHGIENGTPVWKQPLQGAPTRIARGAWIGAHVVILKGVTIGENAIVAAGAVVTRDVPPGTIAGGIPARVLRER
ncbi:MAG: acyltransferase [Phycisphaerales bacterium]